MIQRYFKDLNAEIIIPIIGYFGFSYFLYLIDELAAIPTFSIACVAVVFSYLAYKYTKEKFRLDLMEKRWEIYLNVTKFCSSVTSNGVLHIKEGESSSTIKSKINGIKAAEESFRGLGWHKYKMLFGDDIDKVMNDLNSCFAQLTTKGFDPDQEEYKEWKKADFEKGNLASNILGRLPELFKPYLYFGDYKNSSLRAKRSNPKQPPFKNPLTSALSAPPR